MTVSERYRAQQREWEAIREEMKTRTGREPPAFRVTTEQILRMAKRGEKRVTLAELRE